MAKGFSISLDKLGAKVGQGLSEFENAIAEKQGASVLSAPLSKIEPNPKNIYAVEDIESLAFLIRQQGQLQPALVTPQGNKYRLISGERRYRALLHNGAKTMDVLVIENLDEADEEIILIAANSYRTKSDAEKALEIARLTDLYKAKKTQLPDFFGAKSVTQAVADVFQVSTTQVTRAGRFAALIPELRALAEEGVLGVSTAQMYADLPPEYQKEMAATIRKVREEKGNFSREDGKAYKEYYEATLAAKEAELQRAKQELKTLDKELRAKEKARKQAAKGAGADRTAASALEAEKEELRRELAARQAELDRLRESRAQPPPSEEEVRYRQAVHTLRDLSGRVRELLEEIGGLRNPEALAADGEYQEMLGRLREALSKSKGGAG